MNIDNFSCGPQEKKITKNAESYIYFELLWLFKTQWLCPERSRSVESSQIGVWHLELSSFSLLCTDILVNRVVSNGFL